jgi:predicted negative regulator of RcsB-dependent stress response
MQDDKIDNPQIAGIKQYWQNNGSRLSSMIIVVVLLVGGFKYYQHHKTVRADQGSVIYYNLLNALEKQDLTTVKYQGAVLIADYKATVFADLSHLFLAKIAVTENDLDLAKQHLQDLIKQSPKSPWIDIAKTRLARLFSAQGDYAAALKILDGPTKNYAALYDEIKGDIYLAQNLPKKAEELYAQAKSEQSDNVKSPWLDLKLSDLGEEEKNV